MKHYRQAKLVGHLLFQLYHITWKVSRLSKGSSTSSGVKGDLSSNSDDWPITGCSWRRITFVQLSNKREDTIALGHILKTWLEAQCCHKIHTLIASLSEMD
jgi:hypothetical protein